MFRDIVSGASADTGHGLAMVVSEVWYTIARMTVAWWDESRCSYEVHRLRLLATLDLIDEVVVQNALGGWYATKSRTIYFGSAEYRIGLKLMRLIENHKHEGGKVVAQSNKGAILVYWGNGWPAVRPIKLEYPLDLQRRRAYAAYEVHCVLGDAAFCFCASQAASDILSSPSDKFYERSIEILPL